MRLTPPLARTTLVRSARGEEGTVRVRVLGPIEARDSIEKPWRELRPQQRLVLAVLVSRLGEPCRSDLLAQALWDDDPPDHARRLLQGLVSRLRRRLAAEDGQDCLATVPGGWQLALEPADVDVAWFDHLVDRARRHTHAGDVEAARATFSDALDLWRGVPFGNLADHPALASECARLRERRLATVEDLLELRLRAGEAASVLDEATALVGSHPLRERLHELRLRALYRVGRPADALAAYQQLRERLAGELGAEPGPRLQELHTAILRHDLPPDGPPARGTPVARRRAAIGWSCRRDLPLTGRDRELDDLEAALARVRGNRREVVLVTGEAGIGKTRLVAELADRATSMQVLAGRCSDDAGIPYQPFVEALRGDLAGATDADVTERLGPHAGPLAWLVPELAELVGHVPATPSDNARLDRHHLFTAVDHWLRATAEAQPLLLVLEDLQWATSETLLLLRHLVHGAPETPVALVTTIRDGAEEQPPELVEALADVAAKPGVTELRLGSLHPQDVGHLVRARSGGAPLSSRLAGEVYEATGGNPLFVQELLAGTPNGADELPRAADGHLHVPRTLQRLLAARVQRLSDAATRLLEQAAVAGDHVDFGLVADAADLDPTDALHGLEEAVGARLLVPDGGAPDHYAFGHAVMREALRRRPSPSRRARLHAAFAAALERAHADVAPVAAELAHHLVRAGSVVDASRTRAALRAAGDAAMAQLAHAEAADDYRRALDLLDADDVVARCDLLTALGDAQQHAGPGDHSATLLEALRLAIELADTDRIVAAAWANNRGYPSHLFSIDEERVAALERALEVVGAEDAGARATLLALLGGELTFAEGDDGAGRARRLSDRALELARQSDTPVLARVLMLRQFTIQGPDTVQERLANTAELVPIADSLDDPTLQVLSRQWRAVAALEAADRSEVDARIEEVRARADELGEPFMRCTANMLAATRELSWGDLDAVPELTDRAEQLGLEADAIDIEGVATFQRFWCHREHGDVAPVLPRIQELSARYGSFPHWQALQALAWWELGQHEAATGVLDRFVDRGFDVMRDVAGMHALCCFAEIAAGAGHRPAAERLVAILEPYDDQLDASQAMCTGPVAYFLGRLAGALGERDRARDWLDTAARISRRVGADRWSRRVRLVREELLDRSSAPT